MEDNKQSTVTSISDMGPEPSSALERLDRLEKWSVGVVRWAGQMEKALTGLTGNLSAIHSGASQGFGNIGKQLGDLSTAIQGLNVALRGTMDFAQATAVVVGQNLSIDAESLVRDQVAQMALADKMKREAALLNSGLWEEVAEVGAESLVVLSEKNTEGKVVMLRDHLLLGSSEGGLREVFVGAKVGESRSVTHDEQSFGYEILRILNPVERKQISAEV